MNITNGLPVNHVYNLLIDQRGYLWMGTTKGVVKYNGYDTRIYGFADGLPKEDVWRLYEDKKGRIWLSSIARQIGYIQDDKFHLCANPGGHLFHPKDIREDDSGVYFVSPIDGAFTIFRERNDTMYRHAMSKKLLSFPPYRGNRFLLQYDSSFVKADVQIQGDKILLQNQEYIFKDSSNIWHRYNYILGKYLVSVSRGNNYLNILDHEAPKRSRLYFLPPYKKNEKMYSMFCIDDSYLRPKEYIILTDSGMYLIDSTLTTQRVTTFDWMVAKGTEIPKVAFYSRRPPWDELLSTYTDGVYFHYNNRNEFKEVTAYNLTDYMYIGRDANQNNYWWNEKNKILARVDSNKKMITRRHENIVEMTHVLRYSKDSSIASAQNKLMWMNNHTLQLRRYDTGFTSITGNIGKEIYEPSTTYIPAVKMVRVGDRLFYFNTNGVAELMHKGPRELHVDFFSLNRFKNLLYDAKRDALWAYSNDYVQIFHNKKEVLSISPTPSTPIKSIERIIIDNLYGNILVHDYDRLMYFDESGHKFHPLLDKYNLYGAIVKLRGNLLVAAGRFGVVYVRIYGKGKFSNPIVYDNVKNIYYNYVTDLQLGEKELLLKTENKLYSVSVPPDSAFIHAPKTAEYPYKLYAIYNGTYYDADSLQEINIDQQNLHLQFDVINPRGSGTLKYQYRLAGIDNWSIAQTGDVILPKLAAGKNYHLVLQLSDSRWRSNPRMVNLYIVPYWWQRTGWIATFWLSGIVVLTLFGFVVARFTRQRVERNNKRKNEQLELELKAIYSQINPHFIYNTLNSALLLVHNKKTEEAYTHISKFSKLLRAYVKSSRNKYITVEDEINNLKNYIELQQTRFRNKFRYSITVNEGVDAGSEKIPSLLLQPFVENAINHGLLSKKESGHLSINFSKQGKALICSIEDDGIGREQARELSAASDRQHESFGEAMIKDLINIFRQYEHISIEIKITDKTMPETGTIVDIYIERK
jgi:uncharacterized membrane-anchored protein YhcB (DUF1043 family)